MDEKLIDGLPPTDSPTDAHVVPAMKDGAAVQLSVRQMLDIGKSELEGGAPATLNTFNKVAQALDNDPAAFATLLTEISRSSPSASVAYFPLSTAPDGWLKANGAAISRTTYASLFAAIGTSFGVGDGSTTFNLPDLRGEFLRAWDDGRGVDTGRALNSAQLDAFQGHNLEVRTNTQSEAADISEESGGSGTTGVAQGLNSAQTGEFLVADTFISDGVNGTPRTAGETRPRNIALLACIKY